MRLRSLEHFAARRNRPASHKCGKENQAGAAGARFVRTSATLAICGLGLLLSGCVTAQEQRAADEAQCRSYGFKHHNDAFATCLQRLDLDRRAAMRQAQDFDPWMGPRVIYRPIIVRPRHHHRQ